MIVRNSWFIGFFSCIAIYKKIWSREENWAEAVGDVAENYFSRRFILFLDFADPPPRSQGLLPSNTVDKMSECLKRLGGNWSLFKSNRQYQEETSDFLTFHMGLTRSTQIVAILGSKTVLDKGSLKATIGLWRMHPVWYTRALLLIVIESVDNNGKELADTILNALWLEVKAVNVTVLLSLGGFCTFYTWEPYGPHCRVDAQVAGFWNNKSDNAYSAFRKKSFANLNNCTLVFTATDLFPYVYPPDENGVYFEGIEVRIFNELSTILNFSYTFKPLPEGQSPWLSLLNDTPVGLTGVLHRGEADISLSGSQLTQERFKLTDFIDSYFGDDFTFVGPIAHLTPKWKGVFVVLPRPIWYCLLACFLSAFILIAFMYRLPWHAEKPDMKLFTSFLVVWAMQMNNAFATYLFTRRVVTRTFILTYLFYTTTVNAFYSSGLYGIRTRGLSLETINSPMQAALSGLTAFMFPSHKPDIEEMMPDYNNYITANNLVNYTEDISTCMRRAAQKGDCYFLYPSLCARFQTNLRFTSKSGKKYLHVMKPRYKEYTPVIFMSYHHPLLPIFRTKVRQLVESGWVMNNINDIMIGTFRNRSFSSEVTELDKEEPRQVVSVEEVFGAFVAYAIMMSSALVVFAHEIIRNWWFTARRKKNLVRRRNRFYTGVQKYRIPV